MSCVNIDGKRDVQVAHDGRLLKNMTRRLMPETDAVGLAYIMIQSRTNPQEQERRYLKVLVFEHHSSVAGVRRAKLGKDDVELVNEDKGVHISNLRLTESGLDKVENLNGFKAEDKGKVEDKTEGEEDDGSGKEEGDSSREAPSHPMPPSDEEDSSEGEDSESDGNSEGADAKGDAADPSEEAAGDADESGADTAKNETEEDDDWVEAEAADDEASLDLSAEDETEAVKLKAVPTTEGGSHYDLLDADGNSVLDTYNDGKKVNGKKNLDEIAEDYGVEIVIEGRD